jgi:hypothetical protein
MSSFVAKTVSIAALLTLTLLYAADAPPGAN